MVRMLRCARVAGVLVWMAAGSALAQDNRIDRITPLAPELAPYGSANVGVQTITITDRGRVDVLNATSGAGVPRYDRTLTIEVWYPATLGAGMAASGEYRTISRDPARAIGLYGKAVRGGGPGNGVPVAVAGGYPLVIISHGYPGNRFLMSHLGENLASKGFVVASIDHPDSTYADQKAFGSTLYNRPYDQLFVLDELDRLSRPNSGSFLSGIVDASRTAIIGYSMGGYGLLNVLGAGFSDASLASQAAPLNTLLHERAASNAAYPKRADPRIKAAVAIAPWGLPGRAWEVGAFGAIATPMLFVAGSADDVSGYEKGTRAIFEAATGADRYLLTYLGAGHNAGAPIPAPAESFAFSEALKLFPFMHYADPVWDTVRMNNILQHVATAFLSMHLKGDATMRAYLDVVPKGSDGVYSVERDGTPKADYTYWKGFKQRTAAGLMLEHLRRGDAGTRNVNAPTTTPSARARPLVPPALRTASGGDERDIRRIAMQFESAWASHDADRIGSLWMEDGNMLHPDGAAERGPFEIARNRRSMMAQRRYAESLHPLAITMVTFRGPDVAVVDGRWELTRLRSDNGASAPSEAGLFTWVVQRSPVGWKIAAWRYTLDAPSIAAAR